jgi:hypothetical protein
MSWEKGALCFFSMLFLPLVLRFLLFVGDVGLPYPRCKTWHLLFAVWYRQCQSRMLIDVYHGKLCV